MPGKIFISYRRDDSAGHVGRVHDRLAREFGRDLLFMDVDAVALGVDFVEVLGVEVGKCNVLLAVIGPNWLDAQTRMAIAVSTMSMTSCGSRSRPRYSEAFPSFRSCSRARAYPRQSSSPTT